MIMYELFYGSSLKRRKELSIYVIVTFSTLAKNLDFYV